MVAGELDLVREGLMEVQQKAAAVWETVYGSEVGEGQDVVLQGLTQEELYGVRGIMTAWEGKQSRWVVGTCGKSKLLKPDNVL